MLFELVSSGSLSRASSPTSYPSCSPVSVCHTALFTESKGRGKRHAQDLRGVLGMIAEPNGTDGHRPIGFTWHASRCKGDLLVYQEHAATSSPQADAFATALDHSRLLSLLDHPHAGPDTRWKIPV